MNLKSLCISTITVGMIVGGAWADIITTHYVAQTNGVSFAPDAELGMDITINTAYNGTNDLAVTVDVNPGYGDILGVFFDFDKSITNVPEGSISTLCYDRDGTLIPNNCFSLNIGGAGDDDVNSVGSKGNINLSGLMEPGTSNKMMFDIGIQTGQQPDGGDIDPVTIVFNSSLGLTAADINDIGIRMQQVGITIDNRKGSAKLDYAPDAPAASVPEPSILSLFGLSLLGLGFIRRKKN